MYTLYRVAICGDTKRYLELQVIFESFSVLQI